MTLIETVDRSVPLDAAIWALPVAFIAHDTEECLGISSFSEKLMASLPLPEAFKSLFESTTASFAASVAVIFALFLIVTFIAWRSCKPGPAMYVYALLAGSTLANALTHAFQALVLATYVPGLLFAIIVALPVSAYVLHRLAKEKMVPPRHIIPLIVAGGLMQPIAIVFIAIGKLLV